jgi:hypothetical protein
MRLPQILVTSVILSVASPSAIAPAPAVNRLPPAELNLKLDEGRTLRGIVLGPDGKAVTGAIVSIYQAWGSRRWDFGGGIHVGPSFPAWRPPRLRND